eukprot:8456755-Alexandrium_andersonii.AAC.2
MADCGLRRIAAWTGLGSRIALWVPCAVKLPVGCSQLGQLGHRFAKFIRHSSGVPKVQSAIRPRPAGAAIRLNPRSAMRKT